LSNVFNTTGIIDNERIPDFFKTIPRLVEFTHGFLRVVKEAIILQT